jgi:DNA-binding GntR family transcriptional regulator
MNADGALFGDGLKIDYSEFANHSLSFALFSTLRKAIVNGAIHPGTRLTEVEVSRRMSVSRTPVREAFRKLESENLLLRTPGGKFVVANPDEDEIKEIYLVRSVLEGLAAKIAASKIDPHHVRDLKGAIKRMETGIERNEIKMVIDSNLEFHQLIVQIGHNSILTQTLNRLWDTIQIWSARSLENRYWTRKSVKEHKEIISALEKGDGEMAEKLVRNHIEHAWGIFINKGV